MSKIVRAAAVAALVVASAWSLRAQAPSDEPDPHLTAPALLEAALLKGPQHTVADDVRTSGSYHVFTITSTFGAFEAKGLSQMAVRVQEVTALAALQDLSKAGVFARAAGRLKRWRCCRSTGCASRPRPRSSASWPGERAKSWAPRLSACA